MADRSWEALEKARDQIFGGLVGPDSVVDVRGIRLDDPVDDDL